MNKPLLFLHAGLSKTGSTALQIFFARHATQLLESGLYYPDTDNSFSTVIESRTSSGNAIVLVSLCRKFSGDDDQLRCHADQWVTNLNEASKQHSFKAVLLSSESICTLRERQWAILEDILNKYFDLRLIVFFREPYSWVFSSWLQGVKMHGVVEWLGKTDPNITWAPLFFPEKIVSPQLLMNTIKLFYEECKTDIVDSFFRAIDFAVPHFKRDDEITETANPSLTDQELILMLLTNRLIKGDRLFARDFSDGLLGHSKRPPCYFYSPCVDGLIDYFFTSNGLERQSTCKIREPVVNNEVDWLESQSVEMTLIQSFFNKIAEYINENARDKINDYIQGALDIVKKYEKSIFRTQVPKEFNSMAYLLLNKDVLLAEMDPYEHYTRYGYAEGRTIDWSIFSPNSLG